MRQTVVLTVEVDGFPAGYLCDVVSMDVDETVVCPRDTTRLLAVTTDQYRISQSVYEAWEKCIRCRTWKCEH